MTDRPLSRRAPLSGNALGVAAMLASMLVFTLNDAIVKYAGARLPLGELIVMRNGAATAFVLGYLAYIRGLSWPHDAPVQLLTIRSGAEILSTICFLSGLLLLPFADATAIGQFLPIVITAAAVLLLKERASTELWLAIVAGFVGVLMIVQPGTSTFSPAALLVIAAVGFVAVKELVTRVIGNRVPTAHLALLSTSSVILSGLVLLPFETWLWPTAHELVLLTFGGFCLAVGQAMAVVAMVHGAVAVVQPFRYAAIPISLVLGWALFEQWPNAVQLAGIVVLVAAGLYTLRHQRTITPQPGPPA